MSSVNNKKFLGKDNKNNSKLCWDSSIEYNMDDVNSKFYQNMKKGYIEMAQINLQLAAETELLDINNYEIWLSGE